MYKNASDNKNFLERVASHATKESRTGLIRAIPEWAQEPEEYYNSLRDQYTLAAQQLRKIEDELAAIGLKLKATLPHKEYEHLSTVRAALRERYGLLMPEVSGLRALTRTAGEKAWATVFYHVACNIMDTKDRIRLEEETRKLIERNPFEITAGFSGMSAEGRESERRHKNKQDARKRFRNRYFEKRHVWRDESGGDTTGALTKPTRP